MLNPRVREGGASLSRITDRDLNRFANTLYGYLYYKVRLTNSNQYRSPHFDRVIGKAVVRIRNSVRDYNREFLNKFRFCGSKLSLCQRICDLYPDTDYFKRFHFVMAFILEVVSFWNEGEELRDFSLGPSLWQAMFRENFESGFENKRGWEGLLQASQFYHEVPLTENLFREHLLPTVLKGVLSRIRGLHPNPEQADVDEVAALLEKIHVGSPKKSGLVGNVEESSEENLPEALHNRPGPSGLGSNVFQCESIASLERLQAGQRKEKQPRKKAKVEELSKENEPEALDDRPGTSRLSGKAAQTGHLGSSGKSREEVLHNLGDGKQRKRKSEVPSETESGEKLDSPIPSKAIKDEGKEKRKKAMEEESKEAMKEEDEEAMKEDDTGLRKRKLKTQSKSDSEKESDSPSAPKGRKT